MELHRLERFAAAHHNVVFTRELHELGYSDMEIHRLVKRGYLHRVARGVYVVGSTYLSFRGRCRVALGFAGGGAFISGLAALFIYGIIDYEPTTINVVRSRTVSRRHRNVKFVASRTIAPQDVREIDGIDVASVARAIVDLASSRSADKLTKLLREARYRHLLDIDALEETAHRCRHAGGAQAMRDAIAAIRLGSGGSWSNFESRGWALLHDVIPDEQPVQNTDLNLGGVPTIPDILWRASRVAVELDGAPHQYADVQLDDAGKDRRYRRDGYVVIRITPEELRSRLAEVRDDITFAVAQQRRHMQAASTHMNRVDFLTTGVRKS